MIGGLTRVAIQDQPQNPRKIKNALHPTKVLRLGKHVPLFHELNAFFDERGMTNYKTAEEKALLDECVVETGISAKWVFIIFSQINSA